MSNMEFTALTKKTPEGWYAGIVLEVPGAFSFAPTLEELKVNLLHAARAVLHFNKAHRLENLDDSIFGSELENSQTLQLCG